MKMPKTRIKTFCKHKKIMFTHAKTGSSTVSIYVIDYENEILLMLAN